MRFIIACVAGFLHLVFMPIGLALTAFWFAWNHTRTTRLAVNFGLATLVVGLVLTSGCKQEKREIPHPEKITVHPTRTDNIYSREVALEAVSDGFFVRLESDKCPTLVTCIFVTHRFAGGSSSILSITEMSDRRWCEGLEPPRVEKEE